TSLFLDENRLLDLWPEGDHPNTIQGAIGRVLKGDTQSPHVECINSELSLLPGDLALSGFEEQLFESESVRTLTAFHQVILNAAEQKSAEFVLIDIAPNLSAISRAALIAAQSVVIPLASDLYSVQAL